MYSLCILKNKRKKKAAAISLRLAVICLVFLSGVSLVLLFTGVASGQSSVKKEVMVSQGDTLWSLAAAERPRNVDIRDYIEDIRAENNLDSVILQPGQVIVLP